MADLDVKKLHRDPDAILALVFVLALLANPEYLNTYEAHAGVFNTLLGIAFGGRYLLRTGSVVAKGRVAAAKSKKKNES